LPHCSVAVSLVGNGYDDNRPSNLTQEHNEYMSQMPDVIHVGFSKCASTFLRSFFNEHPQAYLVSDAHFFVPFEHCEFSRGKAHYAGLFAGAKPGQLKVESDEHIVLPLLHPVLRAAATTIESVGQASERVKLTAPDAKIIIIIRNQRDLMLSRYGEYIMGGQDIDFDDFVAEFLRSSRDQVNYYQNYYSQVIETLFKDFSRENVLVLLQEDLFRNESETIRYLCDFVGIDPVASKSDEPEPRIRFWSLDRFRVVARSGKQSKNAGLSLNGIRIMRLWNRLVVKQPEEAYYQKATTRLPFFLYKFGVRVLRVIDYYLPDRLKGNKKALLSADLTEKLRSEFDQDNRRLGDLLGRDLAPLGY
jgi:hypothetical protein